VLSTPAVLRERNFGRTVRAPGDQAGAVDEEASARRLNLRPRPGESCLKSESVVRGRPTVGYTRSGGRLNIGPIKSSHG